MKNRNISFNNNCGGKKMLAIIYILIIQIQFLSSAKAQGLINNGSHIVINNANLIVQGGTASGNYTNQDLGAARGIVDNTGVFSVSGNWTNNSIMNVFGASTGMVNLTGINQSIGGTTTTFFNILSLQGSGTKSLSVNTLVGGGFGVASGVLALNSLPLDLNSHTLTVNNPTPSAISRTSGYIISETNAAFNPGMMQWNTSIITGTYTFPFGVSGTYIPLTINKPAPVNSTITTSTRATAAADNLPYGSGVLNMTCPTISGNGSIPVVIDRWWYIYSSATMTVDISFTYRGLENTTTFAPLGNFSAQNYKFAWTNISGIGPGVTAGTAVVTSFSQSIGSSWNNWVLANNAAPLPIELASFTGKCENQKISLQWSTASESNNDYFTIERRSNENQWQTIATVKGGGNSTQLVNYTSADQSPLPGTNFYRLKQTDFNGNYTYSEIISIVSCKGETNYSIYPNPADSYTQIAMSAKEENAVLHIFNNLGQLVTTLNLSASDGAVKRIDTSKFAAGIYTMSLQSGNKQVTEKLVVRH